MRSGNLTPPIPQALLLAALLGAALGGCAGENLFLQTQRAVATTVHKTGRAVSSVFSHLVKEQRKGWREERRKYEKTEAEAGAAPKPAAKAPVPEDRFPAERRPTREESAGAPKLTSVTRRQVHGKGPKEIVLLPRTSAGPGAIRRQIAEIDKARAQENDPRRRRALDEERKRLADALGAAEEEERIIHEMEALRDKLRTLQKRLLEIQSGGR